MATNIALDWTERGLIPDVAIRQSIRYLVRQRLSEIRSHECETGAKIESEFAKQMTGSAIAPMPHRANEQHYEVTSDFFDVVLGKHRKYSCGYWANNTYSLNDAEAEALRQTCEHAYLKDGHRVLELGCGWGSLTLWMADHFPNATITAVSNSHSQREHILGEAMRRGLTNIKVMTADMNDFSTDDRFDRVVSIEMFEHMRNYKRLFERIYHWLQPGGRFFMHIFCHRSTPYEFVDNGPTDWISRYFFTGGIMPSDQLPLRFQEHLRLTDKWRWQGTHYQKTANAWLMNMDSNRDVVLDTIESVYGKADAVRWWTRWRIFFMACAELFGYNQGQEWWVSHYLFERSH
ncbi:MAG: cyclopropane-fatty-acyl-phospholipid synthase family protein [Gammaproteobacteria bacterium]|nr:cyclopropane-fatty-acyl-phospholipid synthase family protein [Gammaproteobacteria bacterium]